jgi:hypothetical protein
MVDAKTREFQQLSAAHNKSSGFSFIPSDHFVMSTTRCMESTTCRANRPCHYSHDVGFGHVQNVPTMRSRREVHAESST